AFVGDLEEQAGAGPAPATLRAQLGSNQAVPLQLSADLTERTHVFASLNGGGTSGLGLDAGLGARRATLMQGRDVLAPHHDLAGAASGAGISVRPAVGTTIGLAAFAASADQPSGQTWLQRLELEQALAGDVDLSSASA
ncbi:MAG: hypothetical protein HC871_14345, partial [Rhizobiales bacterium]|nr:hypothetical protein [Hyphomicrobiales bacterium]